MDTVVNTHAAGGVLQILHHEKPAQSPGRLPARPAIVPREGGVALAAIQGLNQKVEGRSQRSEIRIRKSEDRIQKLETENTELKTRLDKLEQLINANNRGGPGAEVLMNLVK